VHQEANIRKWIAANDEHISYQFGRHVTQPILNLPLWFWL